MTKMKGINNLKIRRAAIRNGCKLKKLLDCNNNGNKEHSQLAFTYTENSDEPINRWNLKTCYTSKISSSEECNIEEDHLDKKSTQLQHVL